MLGAAIAAASGINEGLNGPHCYGFLLESSLQAV